MKKNKYLFSLSLFAIFFLAGCGTVLAALEQPLDGLGGEESLPQYVKFLFGFIVGLAGIIASISFAVGAVGLILASVSANPEGAKSAKDRMLGAILGLVLTGSSWVILNTINPALVKPTLDALPSISPLAPLPPGAGVIFYSDLGCKGDSTGLYNPGTYTMAEKFAGKIKSVDVNIGTDAGYVIIFHQQSAGNFGYCNRPIISMANGCLPITDQNNTRSVDIVKMRLKAGSAGDGVAFYSEDHGDTAAQLPREGKLFFQDSEIVPTRLKNANEMIYDWTGATDVSEDYKKTHATFQSGPGSIKMSGSYLVGLYSEDPKNNSKLFCQTFKDSVPELGAVPIVAAPGSKIKNVYIMPN